MCAPKGLPPVNLLVFNKLSAEDRRLRCKTSDNINCTRHQFFLNKYQHPPKSNNVEKFVSVPIKLGPSMTGVESHIALAVSKRSVRKLYMLGSKYDLLPHNHIPEKPSG